MAERVEDKDFLAERLEEDRQKMAVQVSELKEDYNLSRRLRASMHKYPWPWIMGAVLTGFLLSRLPARRKEVYLSPDLFDRGLHGKYGLLPQTRTRPAPSTSSGPWLSRLLARISAGNSISM